MLSPALIDALRASGIHAADTGAHPVHGGSISRTLRVETRTGPILVKLEPIAAADRLAAEADGLAALSRAAAIAVPKVLASGAAGEDAFLALEWIGFGARTTAAETRLGEELAELHRQTNDAFGWHRDNFIGRTPQPNEWSSSWADFFTTRRLGCQLELAERNGIGREASARVALLIERADAFLDGHSPEPSLLHGDLWGGNWGADAAGTPYLFDPAAYFGDREADLAMTRLFGGFGAAFYRAYDAAWPPAAGRDRRIDLYNLYHLLNHFNLFGGGYRVQVLGCVERLLQA